MLEQIPTFLSDISGGIVESSRVVYAQWLADFTNYIAQHKIAEKDISHIVIGDWGKHLTTKQGNCESTAKSKRWAVAAFYDWCIQQGFAQINPARDKRLPKLVREPAERLVFTEEQYKLVLVHAGKLISAPYWRQATIISWNTGYRCSDVAKLQWEDVRFETESLVKQIWKTRRKKPGKVEIPMTTELFDCLRGMWENKRFPNSPFVLPEFKMRYEAKDDVVNGFKDICRRAGFPNHSFHCLRHSFITRALNAGVDPITLSQMTGLSVEQMQTYAHISLDAKRAALHRMEVNRIMAADEIPVNVIQLKDAQL